MAGRDGRDGRRLVRTGTPGIFRRERANGSAGSYVVVFLAGGRQRKESARTLAEARAIKAARAADSVRGEFQERTSLTLRAFLTDWIERYEGRVGAVFGAGRGRSIGGCWAPTRIRISGSGCGWWT